MDFEAFRSNPMAVAAVERKLLTVGEAAVRPGRGEVRFRAMAARGIVKEGLELLAKLEKVFARPARQGRSVSFFA
jgi:hypothetical protein